MWIFAYGSLIFRPDFPFVERRRAFVAGYARRFWQGSPDHRGTPEAPGRVVTLVADAEAVCGGCAFRIAPDDAEAILAALDHREKAGFERRLLPLYDDEARAERFAYGVVYIAREDNAHFLGPLDEHEIAAHIATRHGPSGPNLDYARDLHAALLALGIEDPHVERTMTALAAHVARGDARGPGQA